MRAWIINKNLCLYYMARKIVGKRTALHIANFIEFVILVLGRDKDNSNMRKEYLVMEHHIEKARKALSKAEGKQIL